MLLRSWYRAVEMAVLSALILLPVLTSAAVSTRYIETVGVGRADSEMTNKTQRQSTACEAAITEAQAQMLSRLKQTGILKGAKVVRTEWLANEQCRVTLRLETN
jgi:hypothetical protein